jgi:hypothetical protein
VLVVSTDHLLFLASFVTLCSEQARVIRYADAGVTKLTSGV